jgi:hypothetical protein
VKPIFIAKKNGYGAYCYIMQLMIVDNAGCSLLAELAKFYAVR